MTVRMQVATPSNSLKRLLARLWHDEAGQDLVEYALIALAMGLSTVAGVNGLAHSIINDVNIITDGFISAT
jgi:Flp pilus assembly pilin Flp